MSLAGSLCPTVLSLLDLVLVVGGGERSMGHRAVGL